MQKMKKIVRADFEKKWSLTTNQPTTGAILWALVTVSQVQYKTLAVTSHISIGNEDLNPELEVYLDFFVEIASIGP